MRFHEDPQPKPKRPDPRCVCGKAFFMVIRPGEHAHLCPVHPERATYGSGPIYS